MSADTLDQDARTWRAMRLGEDLLLPEHARGTGPREVIARLADLRCRRGVPALGQRFASQYTHAREGVGMHHMRHCRTA
jgi:hypothetical protein